MRKGAKTKCYGISALAMLVPVFLATPTASAGAITSTRDEGIAAARNCDLSSAETLLRKAIAENKADDQAHFFLAKVLRKQNRDQEAQKEEDQLSWGFSFGVNLSGTNNFICTTGSETSASPPQEEPAEPQVAAANTKEADPRENPAEQPGINNIAQAPTETEQASANESETSPVEDNPDSDASIWEVLRVFLGIAILGAFWDRLDRRKK